MPRLDNDQRASTDRSAMDPSAVVTDTSHQSESRRRRRLHIDINRCRFGHQQLPATPAQHRIVSHTSMAGDVSPQWYYHHSFPSPGSQHQSLAGDTKTIALYNNRDIEKDNYRHGDVMGGSNRVLHDVLPYRAELLADMSNY